MIIIMMGENQFRVDRFIIIASSCNIYIQHTAAIQTHIEPEDKRRI